MYSTISLQKPLLGCHKLAVVRRWLLQKEVKYMVKQCIEKSEKFLLKGMTVIERGHKSRFHCTCTYILFSVYGASYLFFFEISLLQVVHLACVSIETWYNHPVKSYRL